jgi:hypothetical protein
MFPHRHPARFLNSAAQTVKGSAPTFALTYIGNAIAASTNSNNVLTYTGVSLGSDTSAFKEVILGIVARQSGGTAIDPPVSLVLSTGSITATLDAHTYNAIGNHTDAFIYRAATTATTDTITFTLASSSTILYSSLTVWQLLSRNQTGTGVGSTSNATVSVTKFAGGATVGIANAVTTPTSTTATGLTKDVDTVALTGGTNEAYSAGHSTGDSAGASTVGLVFNSGSAQLTSIYLPYGP